jgi:hypothetical protein
MQVHRRTTARNGVAIGRSRPVAVRPVAEAPPSGQRDVSAASAATGAVFPQPPPSRPSKQSLLRILGKVGAGLGRSKTIMHVNLCQLLGNATLVHRATHLPCHCPRATGAGLSLGTHQSTWTRAACGGPGLCQMIHVQAPPEEQGTTFDLH